MHCEDTPVVNPSGVRRESYVPGPQKRGTGGTLNLMNARYGTRATRSGVEVCAVMAVAANVIAVKVQTVGRLKFHFLFTGGLLQDTVRGTGFPLDEGDVTTR